MGIIEPCHCKFIKSIPLPIDEIYTIASDRRTRVLLDDQLKWMEMKMKAIKKICKESGAKKLKVDKQGRIADGHK